MIEKNYAGLDGFVWWMGVVESRKDPLELGRCQVRVYGWHSESLADIPSDDLPWATPVNSLNNESFSTPKEGDFVFGFFGDGRNGQVPLIMGIIPHFAAKPSESNLGFNDLRNRSQLQSAPRRIRSRRYNKRGRGVTVTEGTPETYPRKNDLRNPSTCGLARNKPDSSAVVTSRKNRGEITIPSTDKRKFKTPKPSYAPVYPYNQAMETESGHSLEFDDSPGAERVELAHRSGTMFEIQPNGTKVEEVVRDNYKVIMADDYVYVMGKAIVSVDSQCLVKIAGDVKLEVGGNFEIKAAGDVKITSAKDVKISSGKELKLNAERSTTVSGGRSTRIVSKGTTSLSGRSMSLSASSTIRSSKLAVAGKVSAAAFSTSFSPFQIPSFTDIIGIADIGGIADFASIVPGVSEITSQISAVASLSAISQLQSTLSSLGTTQLDELMEVANVANISKIVDSLGGDFNASDLVTNISSIGMDSFVENLDASSAAKFTDELLKSKGTVNDFIEKIPETSIADFAKNLSTDKILNLTDEMDAISINKFVDGSDQSKLGETFNAMAPNQLRSALSSLEGKELQKVFESLTSNELSSISSNLNDDLQKQISNKLNSAGGKYPITFA